MSECETVGCRNEGALCMTCIGTIVVEECRAFRARLAEDLDDLAKMHAKAVAIAWLEGHNAAIEEAARVCEGANCELLMYRRIRGLKKPTVGL